MRWHDVRTAATPTCSSCHETARKVFTCRNHKEGALRFCAKCVKKWCKTCELWHSGSCATKKGKAKSKKKKKTATSQTKKKIRTADGFDVDFINLDVPSRPSEVRSVGTLKKVRMLPLIASKMETIIKKIKTI